MPTPSETPKETFIRFMAPVNPQSADQLLKAIDQKYRERYEKINLLLSSPGGSVFHGLSIYNFLRCLPMDVVTYNFGSVDSIGVIIYCAGKVRYSVPHARFLLHGVRIGFRGEVHVDEFQLHEHLKGVQVDQSNIAKVISDNTGRIQETVEKDMHDRTTLNASQAKDYGLVHEVKNGILPLGADFVTIYESVAQAPAPVRGAIPVPAAHDTFTRLAQLDIGTA